MVGSRLGFLFYLLYLLFILYFILWFGFGIKIEQSLSFGCDSVNLKFNMTARVPKRDLAASTKSILIFNTALVIFSAK
jgi:hypothetical protein